jgi:hypothetical protein
MFSRMRVVSGMSALSDLCQQRLPHPVWDALQSINYGSDSASTKDWLTAHLPLLPIHIDTLYFGLSDTGDSLWLSFLHIRQENSKRSSLSADASDPCYPVPLFQLENIQRVADTAVQSDSKHASERDVRWVIETCYPLVYSGLSLGAILSQLSADLLFGQDEVRRVAVCFAEGDQFFFGEVRRHGFAQYDGPQFFES